MTRMLVAGATGSNGRELLRQLARQRIPVRALVRDKVRAAAIASDTVELIEGDLGKPQSLAQAFAGIRKAYIVTAIDENSVQWFENFFTAAARAGVEHIVKLSAYGAAGDSPSSIVRQHFVSDQMLIESGIGYTILRPNAFYQNLLWQAQSIIDAGQFFLAAGDARQSMVDVRDIAEATAAVLTDTGHVGRIYDLTGPDSLSYHEVAAILAGVAGKRVSYIPVTDNDVRESMLSLGMPVWNADALAEIQVLFASGTLARVEPDLARLLGRTPRSFEQFARDFASSFGGQA